MPAYRSTAEAEVRDAVVARLRAIRPGARIIHEIQNACQGPNRIDLIAVSRAEIIACEVKSERDKLDRLPAQIKAMTGMAHHVIAALHEKHLQPATWAHKITGSVPNSNYVEPPDAARGATVWAFPEKYADAGRTYGCARWQEPDTKPTICLPVTALDMLWADELYRLCVDLGVTIHKRPTRGSAMNALRWSSTGAQLTKGICATLRRRSCCEADPAVEEAA
jgi:hypothetical protein